MIAKINLVFALALGCFLNSAYAQKNFQGEIVYKITGFSDAKRDTTFGDQIKVVFSEQAIKIQRITKEGQLYKEQILFLDSLKEILLDHDSKTCRQTWKYQKSNEPTTALPWGMTTITPTSNSKSIAGLPTRLIRLTDRDISQHGKVDLNASELYFHLPSQESPNLLLEGLLIFKNHLMLQMTVVAGAWPHSSIQYTAQKIVARPVNASEFLIPQGYSFK